MLNTSDFSSSSGVGISGSSSYGNVDNLSIWNVKDSDLVTISN